MNLGRIGHYFTPQGADAIDPKGGYPQGSCRTAIVTAHDLYPDGGKKDAVNVLAFSHSGNVFDSKQGLPVIYAGDETPATEDSFHLNGDCPFLR